MEEQRGINQKPITAGKAIAVLNQRAKGYPQPPQAWLAHKKGLATCGFVDNQLENKQNPTLAERKRGHF